MQNIEVEEKIKHILIEISKVRMSEEGLIELLTHSSFDFEEHWNHAVFPNAYNLTLTVTPNIYTKNYHLITPYQNLIKTRINESSNLIIDKLKILPDYQKLQIINSRVFSVVTEWDEINCLQQTLLDKLKSISTSIDIQTIGLTSRTLMDKISRIVFDIEKHNPNTGEGKEINVSNGFFKNQLHSYIDKTLVGEKNKEFRTLAKSSISFVEDAIDFMNKTTHKIDAEKHLAEVCVISTINAISIINLIRQLE